MPSDDRKTGMPADQRNAPKTGKSPRTDEQQVDEMDRKPTDAEQAEDIKGGLMPVRRDV